MTVHAPTANPADRLSEVRPQERHDLERRADIHDLVVDFYREIVFDPVLDQVFSEVAEVDWSLHIPKLIDYWCQVLLGEPGYAGRLLGAHRHVHDLGPLELEHFDRWYELWTRSIDDHWRGAIAERAKAHAAKVGAVLAHRILGAEWAPPGS